MPVTLTKIHMHKCSPIWVGSVLHAGQKTEIFQFHISEMDLALRFYHPNLSGLPSSGCVVYSMNHVFT